MRALGVHHVAINVRDVGEAIGFYRDALVFTVRSDRPEFGFGGAWLDAGDQQVHLLEAEPPPSVGQHYAVLVSDLDAAVADLRELGYLPTDPSPVGSSRQAFVTDPSGNVVELHQPG